MSSIHKIWGERRRILLTGTSEIDLLYLNRGCFCSVHYHKHKFNKFILLSGNVLIETEYGKRLLEPDHEFEVHPGIIHRFAAMEDSKMLELAWVDEGKIDEADIYRIKQGGKIIKDKDLTLDELKTKGFLNFWEHDDKK